MKDRFIIWTPRIVAVLFILFISLFALDVFNEGYSLRELALALSIHLLPTFALIAALVIAWFFPFWGAAAFLLLSIFSYFFFNTYQHPIPFLIITTPPLIIAVLFTLQGWSQRHRY